MLAKREEVKRQIQMMIHLKTMMINQNKEKGDQQPNQKRRKVRKIE